MLKPGKWLRCVIATLSMISLVGCTSRHDGDEKYYFVSSNTKVSYWQAAATGFTQAASKMKISAEFVGPDTYDPKAQQVEFERVAKLNPSGILVSPADPELMKPDIDAAIAAGIPVITIDTDSTGSKRLFFIGTNNYQVGVMGAKIAVQAMHGRGNVVVFTMPGQSNLNDRLRGYRDTFSADPQMKIVQIVDVKGDPTIAFDNTAQIIGKQKDKVDGFVCLEALSCKEVANVLDRYKVTGKTVIAMDTDAETLEWIRKGVIQATIAQKPYTMSYVGLTMLDDLHHNKPASLQENWETDLSSPLPVFVDTGAALIDKNNVEAFIAGQKP